MWLLYEHPEIEFNDIAMRFMDIRKRIFTIPKLGEKAMMVAIPTTSGTGSEVTPFAVITDGRTGNKYPLADYALTPNMAIVDTQFVMGMPKRLTAKSFRWGMTVCHQSVLIKKELCSYYDTTYRITADYDWVLSAIEKADESKICNTGLFVSKFQQGGISSKNIKKANWERFIIMKKHYGLIPTVWFNVLMLFRLAYTYLKFGRI
jgi:hypothetical protein